MVKLKKCFKYRLRFPVGHFIPNDMVVAIFWYMSFGIKFTTGNLNPYLIHLLKLTNDETVWFHTVIVSCQALACGASAQ